MHYVNDVATDARRFQAVSCVMCLGHLIVVVAVAAVVIVVVVFVWVRDSWRHHRGVCPWW